MTTPSPKQKNLLKPLVKWILFVVVLSYVIQYGYGQWAEADISEVRWSPGWWLAAAVLYFFSWIPAACLWWLLLKQAGVTLPFYPTFRAHFCGHLGKYVPGKALSLVIRAAMLREYRVPGSLAGLMATAETLLTMAVGLLVTISLMPILLGSEDASSLIRLLPALKTLADLEPSIQYAISGSFLLVAILAIPWIARSLQWLITRFGLKMKQSSIEDQSDALEVPVHISPRVILLGSVLVAVGWMINGCSLGCILLGCGVSVNSFADPLLWTAAVASAISIGFLVLFAPGGLGPRELILIAVLQLSPQIDPSLAVIAAALFRMITFLSEVFFSAILYTLPAKVSQNEIFTN